MHVAQLCCRLLISFFCFLFGWPDGLVAATFVKFRQQIYQSVYATQCRQYALHMHRHLNKDRLDEYMLISFSTRNKRIMYVKMK